MTSRLVTSGFGAALCWVRPDLSVGMAKEVGSCPVEI